MKLIFEKLVPGSEEGFTCKEIRGRRFSCPWHFHTENELILTLHCPGLTPRAVLETLAGVQMLDVEVPTTDGRWLVMSRYTQPEKAVELLLARLKLKLPEQPPPTLSAQRKLIT